MRSFSRCIMFTVKRYAPLADTKSSPGRIMQNSVMRYISGRIKLTGACQADELYAILQSTHKVHRESLCLGAFCGITKRSPTKKKHLHNYNIFVSEIHAE